MRYARHYSVFDFVVLVVAEGAWNFAVGKDCVTLVEAYPRYPAIHGCMSDHSPDRCPGVTLTALRHWRRVYFEKSVIAGYRNGLCQSAGC